VQPDNAPLSGLGCSHSMAAGIVFISPVVIPDQIKQFVIQEKIELTILEDPKCEFIYNNGLEDLLYNIYITNKEHKIKLVGNPYKDPILYRHYRKLLKSR